MLKLNEKFKITGEDEYNYTLHELRVIQPKDRTQEARMEWKRAGYFGKISHAISCAVNKYIKDIITEEDMNCKELLERLAEIEREAEKIDVTYPPKIKPIKGINKKEKQTKQEEKTDE